MIEKKLVEALEPLVDQLVAVEKKIASIELTPGPKGLDGEPGKDADPEAVASIVIEKYADALRGDVGAPGAPGRDGEDGRPGADSDPVAVAEILVEKHGDLLRGRDGIGIKSVKVDPDRKSLTLTFDDDQEAEIELPEGPQGSPGAPGRDGVDGLGFDAKAWNPGVYRGGSWVSTAAGKIYRAECDTVGVPGKSDDWERIGPWGFEWKGLKKADSVYENGDLYIDGGTTFLWFNGKGHMFAQRGAPGAKGEPGKDGKDAPHFVGGAFTLKGAALVMSDGSVLEAPIDGIEKAIENAAGRHAQDVWEAAAQQIIDEGGTPIRSFRGQIIYGSSYSVGDVVNFNKSLWIATEANKGDPSRQDQWRRMISAGGGGGGGGAGGITRTTQILADGLLQMAGFGITGLADPRNGAPGALDAVNQQTMQAAIAAGSLYQGPYKPASNGPNLAGVTDSGFTAPGAAAHIGRPTGATQTIAAGNIDVWFGFSGHGFDTFPATLAAPVQVQFTLSNGTRHQFNLPVKVYADLAALQSEINTQIAGLGLVGLHAQTIGGALWLISETAAPLYMTSITGQTGGGFPAFAPGTGNTALNTYNWVVSTVDPNVPEYAPPGIPGVPAGATLNNSDLLQWNATLKKFDILRGGNLTQNFADNRYWQLNAGNMSWRDQPYNKGAVVYGQRFNAWFVATQNIVLGSAEPGTTAAGAIWRKINSTYGSTIFFGKGDYDTAPGHQDAAHNWGMPAGTYPAGQQPLNGDSYFDVTSGTEVQFSVTQNAPLFTLSGVVGVSGGKQGADLGNNDLNGWPGSRTALALPAYWKVIIGVATTPATGVFAGQTFQPGTYLIGFSGDPDADHSGWFIVPDVAGNTANWTINTPHPQAVPDTVTPRVVYGYRRNFELTIGASVAAGAKVIFLKHIPPDDAITHVEIRDKATSGAVYEFEVMVSSGSATHMSPIAVQSHNSHFSRIEVGWTSTNDIFVWAVCDANAHGAIYEIIATSYDYDLSRIVVGNGTDVTTENSSDSIKADGDYPNADLSRMLKAAAGDPTASLVASDLAVGQSAASKVLPMATGRIYRYSGYATPLATIAGKGRPLLAFNKVGGGHIPFTEFSNIVAIHTYSNATEHKGQYTNPDAGGTPSGFALMTANEIDKGQKVFFELMLDKRNPTNALTHMKSWYIADGYNCTYEWWAIVATASLDSIYFSQFNGQECDFFVGKE